MAYDTVITNPPDFAESKFFVHWHARCNLWGIRTPPTEGKRFITHVKSLVITDAVFVCNEYAQAYQQRTGIRNPHLGILGYVHPDSRWPVRHADARQLIYHPKTDQGFHFTHTPNYIVEGAQSIYCRSDGTIWISSMDLHNTTGRWTLQ